MTLECLVSNAFKTVRFFRITYNYIRITHTSLSDLQKSGSIVMPSRPWSLFHGRAFRYRHVPLGLWPPQILVVLSAKKTEPFEL